MRATSPGRLTAVGLMALVALLAFCSFPPGDAFVSVTGDVGQKSGEPLPEVTVILAPAAGSDCIEKPMKVNTDHAGHFSITIMFSRAVKKREFSLHVEKRGFRSSDVAISADSYNLQITLAPE